MLWAAFWLHVPPHTDVLTPIQLQIPAPDPDHITAAHSELGVSGPLCDTLPETELCNRGEGTRGLWVGVAYLQLVVPTLLKPRGQLLVAQAAQDVQEVCRSSLCEISHRPGGGV